MPLAKWIGAGRFGRLAGMALLGMSAAAATPLPAPMKPPTAAGKIVIFQQAGFPTLESQPAARADLTAALAGLPIEFVNLRQLAAAAAWREASALILPYGSAVPAPAWAAILAYLRQGGNLVTLGGRGLMIPVYLRQGRFVPGRMQAAYARALGLDGSYAAPLTSGLRLAWDAHAPSFHALSLPAKRVFVLESSEDANYHGLGFLENAGGERIAAPITRLDFDGLGRAAALRGDRCVFLNFTPARGFWSSRAGRRLIRDAALYARRGATVFEARMRLATLEPGETPEVELRLRRVLAQRQGRQPGKAAVQIEVLSGQRVLSTRQWSCRTATCAASVPLPATPRPGFYQVRARLRQGQQAWEAERLGYWQQDSGLLHTGIALTAGRDSLLAAGQPFFPVGANYFTTAWYDGGFSEGNALTWQRDMAEMQRRGVNFIRTGIWGGQSRYLNPLGGVNLQFRRGLEAFLLAAANHHLQVNFTFTAFNPRIGYRPAHAGGRNPYLDPVAIRAELNYYLSIVRRFRQVPFLSWDLINEPSFSNPLVPWKGNIPNGDAVERRRWQQWLQTRYGTLERLARAWNTTPEALGGWSAIPLPAPAELQRERYGNRREDRAFDYNLFSQAMFGRWVRTLAAAMRQTGSRQLIDVGQDEGGVTDRVLDQFFSSDGVSFTVNHTYWHDNALLWDSLVSHRIGMPDFVGETGVQPAWRADNRWRWNELSAAGLIERKLALGLAAGSTGGLLWAWENGDEFGIRRQDGSDKIWMPILSGVAAFARQAAPYARGVKQPETAILLPESLQFSVFNGYALEAQQHSVRALYDDARGAAYAAGEYQIGQLGHPRLILAPSPWTLSRAAWRTLLEKTRRGATLLISGRFDLDAHFHPTRRTAEIGLHYTPRPLAERMFRIRWPTGAAWLSYPGEDTNYLEYGALPGGQTFTSLQLGKGKLLYFAPPLELNANYDALGAVYRYAMRQAGVTPVYSTSCSDPGISIIPTQYAQATLYVLTSESAAARRVTFEDRASGKRFATWLDPGRAAMALISHSGTMIAAYNWR